MSYPKFGVDYMCRLLEDSNLFWRNYSNHWKNLVWNIISSGTNSGNHCTVHTKRYIGPGFCSILAITRRRRSKQAGECSAFQKTWRWYLVEETENDGPLLERSTSWNPSRFGGQDPTIVRTMTVIQTICTTRQLFASWEARRNESIISRFFPHICFFL